MTPTKDYDPTVVVIEHRALIRECLNRCIGEGLGYRVISYSDIDSWREGPLEPHVSVIIISVGENEQELFRAVERSENAVPVIALFDAMDTSSIRSALRAGVRGCLSTTTGLDVALEVVKLVLAGGVYVPADAFLSPQQAREDDRRASHERSFSARESAVLNAIRKGKPNKLIAFELNMSESTVKVHVHNIMKKLGAKNRTEVAVMANAIAC